MRGVSVIEAIILTASAIVYAQDKLSPAAGANVPVQAPQPIHDPWAVAAHSPNLNLADAIGSTSKQAMMSRSCNDSERSECSESSATARQNSRCCRL
jgi:hypothetical protein